MILDDGLVTFCNLVNTAGNGSMPAYTLEEVQTQYFGERSIGINRAYLAMGADSRIDALIRIHDENFRPRIGMYAVLKNYSGQENDAGDQYRITLVQPVLDDNSLRAYDVTLERLEDNYNVEA